MAQFVYFFSHILIPDLEHRNPRVREDVLLYIIFALLIFPSSDFNQERMAKAVAPLLADQKRRCRQVRTYFNSTSIAAGSSL